MTRWTSVNHDDARKFGKSEITIRHRLNDIGYFTDEALADLIDRYPREYYMLTTMTRVGEKPVWRNGDKSDMSGKDTLQAIKDGQLWLCLRRFDIIAQEYAQIIDAGFEELEAGNPGLKTFKRESSLLISSPGARVFHHADIPFICLWHMRGKKRIWLYDAQDKDQLPDEALEGIILRETEEEIHYDEAWDQHAQTFDLEPGQAISWALNAPHRVVNLEGLNVSITTEFYTPEAQRKYGVYYTNGFMRRYLGLTPKSTNTKGLGACAKCAVTLVIKKLNLAKGREREMTCSFELDRSNGGKPIFLPQSRQWAIHQA